jgi:hypothetical protein
MEILQDILRHPARHPYPNHQPKKVERMQPPTIN